jgi:hypothetical protein
MMKRDLRRKRAEQRRNKRLEKRAKGSGSVAAPETSFADAIIRHVTRHVGAPAFVLHEIESELVHLDVHVVPPAAGRDDWFLFTTGMSARPMRVPGDARSSRFAELVMKLPRHWVFDRATWRREPRWFWPIRELRAAATLPHRHRTWLGPGHTIMSPQGEAFDPSTRLSAVIVVGDAAEMEAVECGAARIDLLTLWPIYTEELEIAMQHGSDALLELFEDAGSDLVIDPARPSVVA